MSWRGLQAGDNTSSCSIVLKRRKQIMLCMVIPPLLYGLLPLVVFDFSETARPYDEEYFNGRAVVIGPRPRWWIPGAAHKFDIPGGLDYDSGGWPFVVWKPLCVWFVERRGDALPSAWR